VERSTQADMFEKLRRNSGAEITETKNTRVPNASDLARGPTLAALASPFEIPEAATGGSDETGEGCAATTEGATADDALASAACSSGIALATAVGDLSIKKK
jgi:hypothetical protein